MFQGHRQVLHDLDQAKNITSHVIMIFLARPTDVEITIFSFCEILTRGNGRTDVRTDVFTDAMCDRSDKYRP